jgi:hypothetical protein
MSQVCKCKATMEEGWRADTRLYYASEAICLLQIIHKGPCEFFARPTPRAVSHTLVL